MHTVPPTQNLVLSVIWLVFGLAAIAAAIAALMDSGFFVVPALLLLAVILFMLSAQRTERFVIEPTKFKKRIQCIALATAVLCSLSVVFNAMMQ